MLPQQRSLSSVVIHSIRSATLSWVCGEGGGEGERGDSGRKGERGDSGRKEGMKSDNNSIT
jgi:hypothetical protein